MKALSDADILKVVDDYRHSNLTVKQIAVKYLIGYQTVYRYLRQHGVVDPSKPRAKKGAGKVKQIIMAYDAGRDLGELAEEFGISVSTAFLYVDRKRYREKHGFGKRLR